MSVTSEFAPRDLPWTIGGLVLGFFVGLIVTGIVMLLIEGFWIFLVIGLPILALQVLLTLGVEKIVRRFRPERQPAPDGPPAHWVRRYSFLAGVVVGMIFAIVGSGGSILGPSA
ncbi:hypothetical protein HKCCE2091_10180 [Rhodobacterales bacterium HKCCE2091]|nr:hypothetical protein [Rhodobacterales bacterium HKCCE2091]